MAYWRGVILVALLLPLMTQATVIRNCNRTEDYVVKVKDVGISPDPAVSGKPVAFDISASTGQALYGGKVEIRVLYFGVPVHTETRDICKSVSCPVAAGSFVLTHNETLPAFTPPGFYTLKITMEGQENEELTCISFNFRISLPPSSLSLVFSS